MIQHIIFIAQIDTTKLTFYTS